jgi:predicted RNA-binding protein with PUA-like domain
MKSELDVYPYSQLVQDGSTHWDGVRNYQARNMMRDAMKLGD